MPAGSPWSWMTHFKKQQAPSGAIWTVQEQNVSFWSKDWPQLAPTCQSGNEANLLWNPETQWTGAVTVDNCWRKLSGFKCGFLVQDQRSQELTFLDEFQYLSNQWLTPLQILLCLQHHAIQKVSQEALVDFSALSNFIDLKFAYTHRIPDTMLGHSWYHAIHWWSLFSSGPASQETASMEDTTLQCHRETLQFDLVHSPHFLVILGICDQSCLG